MARKSQQNLFQGTFKRCDLNSTPKSIVFRVSARFPIGIIYESFHFCLAKIHQNSTSLGCNEPPISLGVQVRPGPDSSDAAWGAMAVMFGAMAPMCCGVCSSACWLNCICRGGGACRAARGFGRNFFTMRVFFTTCPPALLGAVWCC